MQIVSPDFVMFRNLKYLIACITMQSNAYHLHYSERVFSTSQKYNFNVHQISTSGRKFNASGEGSEFTKTPFQEKNSILGGRRLSPFIILLPWWRGVPHSDTPALSPPNLLHLSQRHSRILARFTPLL